MEHESVWDELTPKGKLVVLLVIIIFLPVLLLMKFHELVVQEIAKWDYEKNRKPR